MISLFHAPLPALKYGDLKGEATLEFREAVLNQRLLDSHYAQLRAENIAEFRRLKESNRGE